MYSQNKRAGAWGLGCMAAFVLWTGLIRQVDLQPIGPNGSTVGFATLNGAFHALTGVHMGLYTLTDWLGLVPVAICAGFGLLGLVQWIRRKSLFKVDLDLILLGFYYITVIAAYLLFEIIPINYRPVLIEGFLEASYPSSTTLLVLSVMPTLPMHLRHRVKNQRVLRVITILSAAFSVGMVFGRLFAGVHWLTDIVGAILLSAGLFFLYTGIATRIDQRP